jgi:ABC-type cobalamin/Fe3+-siderophores transport system ATPase subunit
LIQLIHREYHMTTLYVTHDLRTLPPICQRLILMKEGKIWRQGSPESMLREEVLSQLYGAPISVPNEIASSLRSSQ